ncbi:MAG: Flp family type IVb pilin [Erythrobacter sp.]|uniref:Flp family type IVb pilin n=1 Tax=Erythrobacter sp. TaxID=1042 RepID=UPI00261B7406|nr:Flp family type IVb pilin [Erythrobacter sp.]MDJ0977374.1 Flp family type IVb pilin [Erythrobacter sp.]
MVLTKFLTRIGSDSRGATAVEYGLIISLIVIAMVGGLQAVANANSEQWNRVEAKTTEVMQGN